MGKHTPSPAIVKTCLVCGSSFSTKNNNYKYCSASCRKEWFRVKQSEYNRAYRQRHPGRVARIQREYRLRNLDAIRSENAERMRTWREKNPEESRRRARKYYRENAEERREYQRKYRAENQDRVAAQWAVNDAVRAGEIPHVKGLRCARCGEPATEYHHWSYEPSEWLNVEAMCPTCHARADRERIAGERDD